MERIRKEITKIDELAADIKQNGLLNAVTVMPLEGGELRLLAGLRRIKAAQMLGWTEIEVNVVSPSNAEDALRIEISENEQREPFSFSEKYDFGRLLAEIETEKAKERMLAGKKCETCNPVPHGAQGHGGRTRDIVAKKIGMGKTNYDRAKYIVKNATPEVIEQLDKCERSIRGTYDELKAKEKAALPVRPEASTHEQPSMPATKMVTEKTVAKVGPTPVLKTRTESMPATSVTPPKPEKLSDRDKEERAMARLSQKDRETILHNNAFSVMTPEEKVRELQSQLKEERCRAITAETELSRLKDELHNAVYHRDGIISSLERQLESAQTRIKELEAKYESV